MNRTTYLTLAAAAFVLVFLTFVVRGTTRLVIGERLAAMLSLPFAVLAVLVLVSLVIVGVLDFLGLWSVSNDLEE